MTSVRFGLEMTDAVEKVFLTREPNFSAPPLHAARADVRDHVESQEGDHRASYARDRGLQKRRQANIIFREIWGAAQFSTFRQHRPTSDVPARARLQALKSQLSSGCVAGLDMRPSLVLSAQEYRWVMSRHFISALLGTTRSARASRQNPSSYRSQCPNKLSIIPGSDVCESCFNKYSAFTRIYRQPSRAFVCAKTL
jgi:hypothetical protein